MKRVKQNDTFDIMKALMAIMITIIHIIALNKLGILGTFVFPVLRTAVPLFFMISSYLFFSKISIIETYEERKKYLLKAVKRNLQLYLLWFIILSPITFYIRNYFKNGFFNGILTIVWSFITGSTFIASWYIMALIIGLTIIFYLANKFDNKSIFILSILIYTFCVLLSNYGDLPLMHVFHNMLAYWTPYNSFTAGIIWIVAGKMFAENEDLFYFGARKQKLVILSAVILLYLEQTLIVYLKCSHTNDFYFMLVPLCLALFASFLKMDLKSSRAKKLRAFSTITYCLHASFAKVPSLLFLILGLPVGTFPISIIKWILTIITCVLATFIIVKLEKIRILKWLRYLH